MEDAFVTKIYSQSSGISVDKDTRTKIELLLNELSLSPPLVCQFKNGSAHGFLNGKIYTWAEYNDFRANEQASGAVLKELATYHSKRTTELSKALGIDQERAFVVEKADHFLADWPDSLEKYPRFKEMASKETLVEDMKKHKEMIKEMNLKKVMCHGDPNLTN